MEIMKPNIQSPVNLSSPERLSYLKPPIPPKPKNIPKPKSLLKTPLINFNFKYPDNVYSRSLSVSSQIVLNNTYDKGNNVSKNIVAKYSNDVDRRVINAQPCTDFLSNQQSDKAGQSKYERSSSFNCMRVIEKNVANKLSIFEKSSKVLSKECTNISENDRKLDENNCMRNSIETTREKSLSPSESIESPSSESSENFEKLSPKNSADSSSTLMELMLENCVDLCSKSSGSSISLAGSESDTQPLSKNSSFTSSEGSSKSRYSFNSCEGNYVSSNGIDTESNSYSTNAQNKEKKAFLVANEIKTSEKSFVEILRLLNEQLSQFLLERDCIQKNNSSKNRSDCISEQDLNEIFKYLPHLQSLSEDILRDFDVRISNWENHPKIADVLVKKGPFLKLYATYITELEHHTILLESSINKYPHFGYCLREFEKTEFCAQIPISKHMLTPMQRITKYKELMKQYLKYIPEDGLDYKDAKAALKIVKDVAQHANEAIREFENSARLLSLQERLNGLSGDSNNSGVTSPGNPNLILVEPGRKLLKEGQVMKLCRRDVRLVYLILMSDCLLYTTQDLQGGKNCSLKLRYRLPLEGMRVDTPVSEDFQTEFSVISTSRSFTVRTRSTKERDEWLSAIRGAIESNAHRRFSFEIAKTKSFKPVSVSALGKQAPAWVPDNRVTMCQSCTAEFSLTFRRHHCRACGKVVCRYCSANRAPLAYMNNHAERVCDPCFVELKKEVEAKEKETNEKEKYRIIKRRFKKSEGELGKKIRVKKPERLLEVSGGDHGSQICGYLRHYNRKSWRQSWFALKDKVLYEYRAPEDVCALNSLPVLGYRVNSEFENVDFFDGLDRSNAFQLLHSNQPPFIFYAESYELAEKWRSIMEQEVVL